MHYRKPDLKE
jgi:hypothetical protein